MTSVQQLPCSGYPLIVDLQVEPESMSFSWSGIKLFVELCDEAIPEHGEADGTSEVVVSALETVDREESANELRYCAEEPRIPELDGNLSLVPLSVTQEEIQCRIFQHDEQFRIPELEGNSSHVPLSATYEEIQCRIFQHDEQFRILEYDGNLSHVPLSATYEEIQCRVSQHDKQVSQVEEREPAAVKGQANGTPALETPCTDWEEPRTPDGTDSMVVDYDKCMVVDYDKVEDSEDSKVDRNQTGKKVVTFSDHLVTVCEHISNQEERETDSFSFMGSSDDELDQGTDQVTSSVSSGWDLSELSLPKESSKFFTVEVPEENILDSTEVSAATHLLELGKESNFMGSLKRCARLKRASYNPQNAYLSELGSELSELLAKIQAAIPLLSMTGSSPSYSPSTDEVGTWSRDVSQSLVTCGTKRTTPEEESDLGLQSDDSDDYEILDRPPSKRQYRSVSLLMQCAN